MYCRREGVPYRVIGQGSNTLASDDGYPGTVLRACGRLRLENLSARSLVVDACSRLDDFARACAARGWGGWAFANGLPGTLGGAVAGNAGAFGSAIAEHIERVLVLDRQGRECWMPAKDMGFAYRTSRLAAGEEVALAVAVRVDTGHPPARLQAERRALLSRRAAMHPDWRRLPNAGSVFRNPPAGPPAGVLLEQAGVHSWQSGAARVWERHANIIVLDGDRGQAREVWALMQRMAAAVRRRSGVRLEPEVRLLGSFPPLH